MDIIDVFVQSLTPAARINLASVILSSFTLEVMSLESLLENTKLCAAVYMPDGALSKFEDGVDGSVSFTHTKKIANVVRNSNYCDVTTIDGCVESFSLDTFVIVLR